MKTLVHSMDRQTEIVASTSIEVTRLTEFAERNADTPGPDPEVAANQTHQAVARAKI